jgi:hypothetical protein
MADQTLLVVALTLAGVASAGIIGVALGALLQRRTWPYLLVTLALATLLARSAVGIGGMWGWFSMDVHHTTEHVLDVVMAGLVIAAVWSARWVGGGIGE